MLNTPYKYPQTENRIKRNYRFEMVDDQRWGIYVQDRLLATIGSYEACKSLEELLDKDMSYAEAIKATLTFKKSINRYLIVG